METEVDTESVSLVTPVGLELSDDFPKDKGVMEAGVKGGEIDRVAGVLEEKNGRGEDEEVGTETKE